MMTWLTWSCRPDTARALFSALCRKRVEAAGATLGAADGEALCEVSPLLSYQGEGLEPKVSGKTLSLPVDLREG